MTADKESPGEEKSNGSRGPSGWDVNAGSVGRVDWSPLSNFTGFRPQVSKYGLARYSPLEWRTANATLVNQVPSSAALHYEMKNLLAQVSSACDKEQNENTLRLKQRASDICAKNIFVCQYCEDLRSEVEQLSQCKLRLRKAMEYLSIVEGINAECREIRKNRLVEDLVRDEVEEELFQEMGLCQQIKELYEATLNQFDIQYKTIKGCYQEVHSLWSDQRETLELETENIGLKSSSDQISFVQGNARLEENMSSKEIWENYLNQTLATINETIENSKALRRKIHSPILSDSARDLKRQDEKILQAFLRKVEEETNERQRLEMELNCVLKDIVQTENQIPVLIHLGRKADFNLKVVQTRLENRRHRPGAENCRDAAQFGLIHEMKVINEEVTRLEVQLSKINTALDKLYSTRKNLERQIHVKRHTLYLDQDRCMRFRSKFPNTSHLMGY